MWGLRNEWHNRREGDGREDQKWDRSGGDLNRERERWTQRGHFETDGHMDRNRQAGKEEQASMRKLERVPMREQEGDRTHRNPWRMECTLSLPNLTTVASSLGDFLGPN